MDANSMLQQLMQHCVEMRKNDEMRNTAIEQLSTELRLVREHTIAFNTRLVEDPMNDKFNNLSTIITGLREENRSLSYQLNTMERNRLTASYVVLLVDGDSTNFNDDLVKAGLDGGRQAAQTLMHQVETYLTEHLDLPPRHQKIKVRIYLNKKGLGYAYQNAGIAGVHDLQQFIAGFNRELPLAEFVDAGEDKEAADGKIKANMELDVLNEQCKHVLLAGSADKGYVSFLRQFSSLDKITLVEAVPFPWEFRELATRFRQVEFREVFRSEKIDTSKPNSPQSHPASPSRAALPFETSIKNGNGADEAPRRLIHFNKNGQRIDDPLPEYKDHIVNDIKSKMLCSRHFLSRCRAPPGLCKGSHKGVLTQDEKSALLRLSRFAPCRNGERCDDRDCVAGHHCIFGVKCRFALKKTCKFDAAMHGVDMNIVKTI